MATDDVKAASARRLQHVPGGETITRMAEYREEHPEATEYSLGSEEEARALLLAIADQVRARVAHKLDPSPNDRRHLVAIERQYRLACAEGRALKLVADMTEEDQLEVYGLKIVVPAVVVQ